MSDEFARRDGWAGFFDTVREQFFGIDLEREYWDKMQKECDEVAKRRRAMTDEEFRLDAANRINNQRESLGLERINNDLIHVHREKGCYIAHIRFDDKVSDSEEFFDRSINHHLFGDWRGASKS